MSHLLTEDEKQALDFLRKRYPTTWKIELQRRWMTGSTKGPHGLTLYRLRGTWGPKGLLNG